MACYNSRISASQCFLSSRTNTRSYHSRYAILFSSSYPVAGPGSVLLGSIAPGYVSSYSASAFPAASFPPFVVGPGFPPVAPKIVAAIVSGEFIELASLLEDHIEPEPPCFTLVADQLVIRPTKRRKAMTDILSWMQAFAVYSFVVTAYYPARVTDLLKYQLLIMRTAQQFSGSAWLAYDRAYLFIVFFCVFPRSILHTTDSSTCACIIVVYFC